MENEAQSVRKATDAEVQMLNILLRDIESGKIGLFRDSFGKLGHGGIIIKARREVAGSSKALDGYFSFPNSFNFRLDFRFFDESIGDEKDGNIDIYNRDFSTFDSNVMEQIEKFSKISEKIYRDYENEKNEEAQDSAKHFNKIFHD